MAPLPAFAWISVGIGVTIVSVLLNIPLFIFIGLVFSIIGVIKAIVRARKAKPREKMLHTYHTKGGHHQQQKAIPYKQCHVCGKLNTAQGHFCNYCGNRIP